MTISRAEYQSWDAMKMAELVRTKQLHPRELLAECLAITAEVEPKIASISGWFHERSRKRVEQPAGDGPLAGVPFFLKDQIEVGGEYCRFGSGLLRKHRAEESHEISRRLEASGLVFVGQTKTSELGLVPLSEPEAYGAVHNPWSLRHSAGGSSGGSGALVAARAVPAAHAADGGGSIRVPASNCGLLGLKPSRGRNPSSAIDDVDGFVVHHAVTQSVRDNALLLDITAGRGMHSRSYLPAPEKPFLQYAAEDPKKLRVAFSLTGMNGERLHRDCVVALEKSMKQFADLGHHVEEARPNVDAARFGAGFRLLWAMGAGYYLKAIRRILEDKHVPKSAAGFLTRPKVMNVLSRTGALFGHPLVEKWTLRLAEIDAANSPGDLWIAWNDMRQATEAFATLFESYDAFVSTTLGVPPLLLGSFDSSAPEHELAELLFRYVNYCPVANTAGFPGISIPLHFSSEGLPIGIHVMAPMAREDLLFSIAGQLERAYPWAHKHPTGL